MYKRQVKCLINTLNDMSPKVQVEAARSLAILGWVEAVPHLIECLSSGDSNVQLAALIALGELTGRNFMFEQSDWEHWWKRHKAAEGTD